MHEPTRDTQQAPLLIATDVFGNKINLVESKSRYTLLAFLRYSGCPFCNLALYRLTIEYPLLKAEGCDIVAIVQSDKEAIMDNIYARHKPKPQFPIIADHEMKHYKQFDVNLSISATIASISKLPYWLQSVRELGFNQKKLDGELFLVPEWFLINNKDGEIINSQKGISLYNHESFTPIYESLIFKD